MASSSATATADTLISLKVNLDGTTRRFKLPLRDLGANIFEDKLRGFLQIPNDTTAVIERYSDSATSYVTLTQSNVSVYKQLYRAAKAKQKLKLRVTTQPPIEPTKEIQAPKPVTIEDEPEEKLPEVSQPDIQPEAQSEAQEEPEAPVEKEAVKAKVVVGPNGVIETVFAPRTSQEFPSFVQQWRSRGNPRIHLRRDANGSEVVDFLRPSTTTKPLVTHDSPEGSRTNSSTTLADLMRDACERELATIKRREARAQTMKELMAKSKARLSKAETTEPPKPAAPVAKQNEETKEAEVSSQPEGMKLPFTVCCNSCDRAVPEAHFHCSICDDGDFDLCQDCVNRGISCYGDGHWLIKRTVVNGDIKCSSTHIAPKSARPPTTKPTLSPATSFSGISCRLAAPPSDWNLDFNSRTCNCCVQEFREAEFVHCTSCDDYDLCKGCFAKNQHGHHPKHGFTPAVKGTVIDPSISSQLAPGRNVLHNAICDGCDKYVRGIRHKCLDCPDWDYCSDCVKDASFIHANHRFVAIYEPLADRPFRTSSRATHYGISCDGPLCAARDGPKYIVGERYKCAVCHDTDFCANCEASPANTHNKTHPLIKFKTPVRHVSVTTTGEHEDGHRLPTMGDRCHRSRSSTQSPEKLASTMENIAATPVQTVVNVQPTEQLVVPASNPSSSAEIKEEALEVKEEALEIKEEALEIKEEANEMKILDSPQPPKSSPVNEDLIAVFKWDTIRDGSVLPPNHTFEQTWVLRNEGTVPWPAGCAVKFVGGDYMGAVDPAHPAGIHELVSASESTICYNSLSPGQEFPFTVLMRTPDRDGKVISYWRLTTPDGVKFGHKLWCDVDVRVPPKAEQAKAQIPAVVESETEVEETTPTAISQSRMIIPKLEHESPSGSIHEARSEIELGTETDTLAPSVDDDDEFEDCGGQDDWAEESDNGFFTDEEYDILDASDEEFLFEQQKMLSKN
ncbi:hypothetical protein O1611_g3318 [Lasiodiplodia mahajangana]|uniref:Uncharacterized protein n=1 Tax=Lasiodiplodia mahajangana TaxID=1108764 RepID=A0ACC2JSI9_9PEZI|nr:hypothetical protein O1611_g3318 [Lasiodiplodia mahajangana]